MDGLISTIMATDSPVIVVIFALLVTFLLIKELYAAVKWIKDRLNGYYNVRNEAESKDEEIENRVKVLEKHDTWQFNKLNEIGEELKQAIILIKEVQSNQAKNTIDTYKGSIFRIYHDAMKNGFISQTELDRFIEIVHIYKNAGGDGVVDEKIYPEVLALPIKNRDSSAQS